MFTRIILSASLFAGTITACAQRNYEEVKVDSKSLSTDNIRSVDAETEGGNISIEGVSSADARIEIYAWARGTEATVKQKYAENYELRLYSENGKLTVSAKRKNRNRDSQVSVSFRIYVPESATSDLRTSGGNIHCQNLSGGKQEVKTSGGNISLEKIKSTVEGKTSGGNITIRDCEGETLELYTSGGNIEATKTKGKLTLNTSGGNISLDDLAGTIEAKTSGGNVGAELVSGSLNTSSSGGNLSLQNLSCSLDASTSGGNMHVTMRKPGEYIKLHNRGGGHTHLELPEGIGMNIKATGNSVKLDHSTGFNGDFSERSVSGTVNGGGIPVSIDGGDSKVVVTFRKQ